MSIIRKERVHRPSPKAPAVALLDCRVCLHRLIALGGEVPEHLRFDWFRSAWALIINRPLPWLTHQPLQGWCTIVVDDYKDPITGKYWRTEQYPAYKANRPAEADRSNDYHMCFEAISKYLANSANADCPIPLLREPGFEADDWAGAAYRIITQLAEADAWHSDCFLLTIDSDWLQLVSDKHRIWFANFLTHTSRLRGEYEAISYMLDKGFNVLKPSDIIRMKAKYGDIADNIGPGSPTDIITLIAPSQRPADSHLARMLANPKCNTSNKHYLSAKNWLTVNNLPIPSGYL